MQVLVIGAGVVGLATARAAAQAGHDVVVAEAANAIGTGTSSRNSEVIHAGLYYPTGTLRAKHCVLGRRMLYDYCASHGVPHRKLGKLVVATNDAGLAKIESIHKQATINGVESVELIGGNAARAREPELSCLGALVSPETGIIDSHSYMLALRGDLEDAGGVIAFNAPVKRVARSGAQWAVSFGGSGEIFAFDAAINCAGHGAQEVARNTEGYPQTRVPRHVLAKGSYFSYSGRAAFSQLIYPAPVEGGLGIHVTLDMAGRMRFGPDVEWIEREDYTVNPARAAIFYDLIRTYWPGLRDGTLSPDYSGIRPKISGKGESQRDFYIDAPRDHGLPNLVHLFGIESPGLTSSLSLGQEVAGYLKA